MPIYEYACDACGHQFEHFIRGRNEKGPAQCPQCGAKRLRKNVSVFASASSTNQKDRAPYPGACGRCGDPHGPCS